MTSERGTIGRNSRIFNSSSIRNVKIGPYTSADGAERLNEGSVNSCMEDPVFIGPGVIMEHFIACSGSWSQNLHLSISALSDRDVCSGNIIRQKIHFFLPIAEDTTAKHARFLPGHIQ